MQEFQLFVAEHTRRILAHLQDPDLAYAARWAAGLTAPESAGPGHMQIDELDAAAAEMIGGGHYVFPAPAHGGAADWHLMIRADVIVPHDAMLFKLTGILPARLATETFLAASYRALFGREVDPVGLADYAARLDAGQITRRDLFKILLASEEAEQRQQRFLLIPDLSPGVAGLGGAPEEPAASRRFIVRK